MKREIIQKGPRNLIVALGQADGCTGKVEPNVAGFIDVACPQGSDTAPDVLQKLADDVVRDGCLQVGRGAEMMGDASVRHA